MKRGLTVICACVLLLGLVAGADAEMVRKAGGDNDQVVSIDTTVPDNTWIGWISGQPIHGLGFDTYNNIQYAGGYSRVASTDNSVYIPHGSDATVPVPMLTPLAPGIFWLPAPYNNNTDNGYECVRDGNATRLFAVSYVHPDSYLHEFALDANGVVVGLLSSTLILNATDPQNPVSISQLPSGLAFDEGLQKLITTNSNGDIWQMGFDGLATKVSTFAGNGSIAGLGYGSDGIMYAGTSDATDRLIQLDVTTGAVISTIESAAQLSVYTGSNSNNSIQALCTEYTPVLIPEPGLVSLMLTGIAGLLFARSRRK